MLSERGNDHAQFVEEPESMENSEANAADGQENANRPSTYHGSQSVLQHEAVRRDMSLPGTGYERSPKSTSAKRHKCPYCSTDFTRHHNPLSPFISETFLYHHTRTCSILIGSSRIIRPYLQTLNVK